MFLLGLISFLPRLFLFLTTLFNRFVLLLHFFVVPFFILPGGCFDLIRLLEALSCLGLHSCSDLCNSLFFIHQSHFLTRLLQC